MPITLVKALLSWRAKKKEEPFTLPHWRATHKTGKVQATSASSQKSHEVWDEVCFLVKQWDRRTSYKDFGQEILVLSHLPTKVFQSCLSFHFKLLVLFFYLVLVPSSKGYLGVSFSKTEDLFATSCWSSCSWKTTSTKFRSYLYKFIVITQSSD